MGKLWHPHTALCSFCLLPQSRRVNWKCSEGYGTPQVQQFRVALDNRNALRGKSFGEVLWVGLEDAMQPSSFFAFLPPSRPGALRKLLRATRLTLQLLPTSAVFK